MSLEDFLFKHELESPGHRQPPIIEKVMESLLECRIISVKGLDLIFSFGRMAKGIETLSLQQRDRSRLLKRMRNFSSWKDYELLDFVNTLCVCGSSYKQFVGFSFQKDTIFFSRGWSRTKHCMGLADAVHMSLLNLDVKVNFPRKVKVSFHKLENVSPSLYQYKRIQFGLKSDKKSVVVNRLTTRNRRFRLCLHFLRVFPKGLLEKEYVKLIKFSLVDNFCVEMEQERPKALAWAPIELFPSTTRRSLEKLFRYNRAKRCQFHKNLLESKSLCAEVGRDMIDEAYAKHQSSLCRPLSLVTPVPDDYLHKLFLYGSRVGKFISKVYKPFETKLPNTRATVEVNREKGGARKALQPRVEITRGPPFLQMYNEAVRPEPFVVGLFGPPGSGKTTSVNTICQMIGASFFPSLEDTNLIYSRSCSTKHWDGYKGQPIVILDDFGQNLSDRSDLVEFEQLVSVNRYILPMADLEEKGTPFISPVIIVTSNVPFRSILVGGDRSPVVQEERSVWRRFHLPVLVEKKDGVKTSLSPYQIHKRPFHIDSNSTEHRGRPLFPLYGNSRTSRDNVVGQDITSDLHPSEIPSDSDEISIGRLVKRILDEFREHGDFHARELSSHWRQNIASLHLDVRQGTPPFYNVDVQRQKRSYHQSDVSIDLLFPSYPPFHKPVVEAIALPEPLKVRMITKAEAETKVLQPFQQALFQYLRSQHQFGLTHGLTWNNPNETFEQRLQWIERIELEIKEIASRKGEEELWLSGDYTAATDNFPLSVTNALIEGILLHIDHEPTRAWVRYETSPHRIRYPSGKVGEQTSGQLMGSLLSFPLLCFLNDFIVSESGFERGKYLINGDDVVAVGSTATISKWKENCPKVGLELSIGKNFTDKEFCTVNSQLFFNGSVLHTGKVSCQTRYGKTLSRCYAETQFYFGCRESVRQEFIRRNLVPLRSTPRSLDIPVHLGGLGLVFSGRAGVDFILAKRVFLHNFLSRLMKSQPVPGYDYIRAMHCPVGISGHMDSEEEEIGETKRIYDLFCSLNISPPDSVCSELTHGQLAKTISHLQQHHTRHLNQILELDLKSFPEVDSLQSKIVYVQKGKVGFLKQRFLALAMEMLREYVRLLPSVPASDRSELILLDAMAESLDEDFDEFYFSEIPYGTVEEMDEYMHLLPAVEPVVPKLSYWPHEQVDVLG